MGNFKKHFEKELKILESSLKEGESLIISDFVDDIYNIIDKFEKQGHSGGSAPYSAEVLSSTIKRILTWQTLSDLTGADDEWNEITKECAGHTTFQNIRNSAVFKHGEEHRPYYLDAIIFQGEDEWDTFTGTVEDVRSKQYFLFPFTPKKFYIDVYREPYDPKKPEHEKLNYTRCADGDYVYRIKDREQLRAVEEVYEADFKLPKKEG